MSKTFHREAQKLDGEYGDYFMPHATKDNTRARRLKEMAKKKRYTRDEDDMDYDT